ncbi:MAG TPA: mechanosensitive ion channel family protein [Thermomicrobiaceae bacterium]|nr:mechanosensitive ion channel family protein [Thermomicrobiaceae bacterium]
MESFLQALRDAGIDALKSVGLVAERAPRFLAAILVVLLFAALARLVGRLVARAERLAPRRGANLDLLIQQLVVAGVIIFGVAVGFGVLGLSLTTIAASFGVVGLVVGFALKDLLENFVAGVIILWRRPFSMLDEIRIGDTAGTVREINFRTTTLRTDDGIEVLIPNSQIFNRAVYNLTGYASRRTSIVLSLPHGADLERARRVLCETIADVPGVLGEPPPEVLVLGSAGENDELHVRYWTASGNEAVSAAESAARPALNRALRESGLIEAPQAESTAPTPASSGG